MTTPQQHTPACRHLLEQLSAYIDGDLEAHLCAQLEAHLADCPDCRIMVDTTQKTIALYRRHYRQTPLPLPADISSRLWQALEESGCGKNPSESL